LVLHFDGTFQENERDHVAVILMLRDPVERAISHFRHVQSKDALLQNISMAEFFNDRHLLLQYRAIWQDGQAAVSWLTGTHIAADLSVPSSQVPQREILASPHDNLALLLHLAADRLEQTLWFGILEDVERSMELLQSALHLPLPPPKLPHLNQRGRRRRRKRRNQETTTNDTNHNENENEDIDDQHNDPANDDDDTAALRSLLYQLTPQDHWLYEYGTMLLEARYAAYRANSTVVPPVTRPPLPAITCWSTRLNISCPALDEYIDNYDRRHLRRHSLSEA
jgi:hypothetical protein